MNANWSLSNLTERINMSSVFVEQLMWVAVGLIGVVTFISLLALVLVYAERKICAHIQCRLGPMRVGWHGILQTLADGIKLFLKEDIIPDEADRLLYFLAPFFCLVATLLSLLVIPLSPQVQIIDVNIGVIYLGAVSGFGILGVIMAGWGSNNKWSALGAMRAGAQMVSYEISTTLSLLVIVLFVGSLQLSEIVLSQQEGWWIWRAHGVGVLAFILLLISSVAELNRTPFDLAEGESELTAGFHTEYSGVRFSFFFLAEFINMFILAAMMSTFFLGGWMPFHIGQLTAFNAAMDLIPPAIWFIGKTSVMIFVFMWIRWTFPRLRVDQLMKLEWQVLMPLGFVNLFLAAIVVLTNFYFFA
ncbi:MAG: NADH-quinone oxidoreductase subunit NuoH [Bdellovibrionaceae bacterium]|jgi:NADH-quinone oxidoreductase subunit H|nr:NADH-quinone oxidoreductase subunit NuoH [Pseudobdellovibrionaceae bacterium]